MGGGGSSLFVISWVWVDFMVRWFGKCVLQYDLILVGFVV